jgi:hypothetical protein
MTTTYLPEELNDRPAPLHQHGTHTTAYAELKKCCAHLLDCGILLHIKNIRLWLFYPD